jgi:hypothetical protein
MHVELATLDGGDPRTSPLQPWLPAITKSLALPPDGVCEALAVALGLAKVTIADARVPIFVGSALQSDALVAVGAHAAWLRPLDGGRVLDFEFHLDGGHVQELKLRAIRPQWAELVHQSLRRDPQAPRARPVVPAGKTAVRFVSDDVAARDAAVLSFVRGSQRSTTDWVHQQLASRGLTWEWISKRRASFIEYRPEPTESSPREVSLMIAVVARYPGVIEIIGDSLAIDERGRGTMAGRPR